MSVLELALRILAVLQLGLLARLMLRARRRDHAGIAGALLALSVAAFMLTSMPGAARLPGVLIYPLTAVCSTHPVWFWLFCTALFSDSFRFSQRHLIAVAVMAALGLAYQAGWHPRAGEAAVAVNALGLFSGAASLAFACLAPIAVFSGGRTDLDERRRRIRRWFVPVASIYLSAVIVTQGFVLLTGGTTPKRLVLANLLFILLLSGAALTTFVRMRVVNWMDLSGCVASGNALSPLEQRVLGRLQRRFVAERLYARDGLSIASLAEALGTQEYVLRRVINRGLGFRNFNDFLHSHRLREAAAKLRDPAQRRTPILTIALAAGYRSIGPFNRAFKQRFLVTPGEYRRSPVPYPQQAAASLPGES